MKVIAYNATRKPRLALIVAAVFLVQQFAWIRKEPKRGLQSLRKEKAHLELQEIESAPTNLPEHESESTMVPPTSTLQGKEPETESSVVPSNYSDLENDFQATMVSTSPKIESEPNMVFSNSSFLGCVLPRPELPVCKSGRDFLSIENGGFWKYEPSFFKDKSLFDGFEFKKHTHRAPCDSNEYTDPYVWSSSCSVPATSITGEQPVRVMLSGDSLMMQVHDTSSVAKVHPSIEFSKLYIIPLLTSINFTSKVCESCGDVLRERASSFDKDLAWLDDDEYLAHYSNHDFVFYNEFAHFSGGIVGAVLRAHEESLPDGEQADEGSISELMAEIFKRVKAKVYYLTSPAHAYQYIVSMDDDSQAMGAPLMKPTRVASSQDCYSHRDSFAGAFCYSTVNSIASTAFQSAGHGIIPMDSAMGRRVDAHPCRVDRSDGQEGEDCLHYCLPGPPSVMLASIVVEEYLATHLTG